MLCDILSGEASESTLKQIKLGGREEVKCSRADNILRQLLKIVKLEKGKVKIIFRGRIMADNSRGYRLNKS